MAWERDRASERVDLAQGMYVLPLVNRAVKGPDGQPLRFDLKIQLGTGHDGESCPHCHQAVERGYTLGADGALRNEKGEELKPEELAGQYLKNLDDFHRRMEAHAARHRAAVERGPKK